MEVSESPSKRTCPRKGQGRISECRCSTVDGKIASTIYKQIQNAGVRCIRWWKSILWTNQQVIYGEILRNPCGDTTCNLPQARSQALRFGGAQNIFWGQDFCFVTCSNKQFSGHNKIWGALPPNAPALATGLTCRRHLNAHDAVIVCVAIKCFKFSFFCRTSRKQICRSSEPTQTLRGGPRIVQMSVDFLLCLWNTRGKKVEFRCETIVSLCCLNNSVSFPVLQTMSPLSPCFFRSKENVITPCNHCCAYPARRNQNFYRFEGKVARRFKLRKRRKTNEERQPTLLQHGTYLESGREQTIRACCFKTSSTLEQAFVVRHVAELLSVWNGQSSGVFAKNSHVSSSITQGAFQARFPGRWRNCRRGGGQLIRLFFSHVGNCWRHRGQRESLPWRFEKRAWAKEARRFTWRQRLLHVKSTVAVRRTPFSIDAYCLFNTL